MEEDKTVEGGMEEKKNVGTTIVVSLLGVVSTLYLLNPGWGAIELIPDGFPVIGNLDEAAATALLISCLAYFGVDVAKWFGFNKDGKNDDVIDINVDDR